MSKVDFDNRKRKLKIPFLLNDKNNKREITNEGSHHIGQRLGR